MSKVSITDFEVLCAGSDQDEARQIKAKLLREIHVAKMMLALVDKRINYLERFNFHDITKLARDL